MLAGRTWRGQAGSTAPARLKQATESSRILGEVRHLWYGTPPAVDGVTLRLLPRGARLRPIKDGGATGVPAPADRSLPFGVVPFGVTRLELAGRDMATRENISRADWRLFS
mmetsp:Transcript_18964/g.57325  ORF Transcript_18964/g.57325 Transcript_18964/m.57325 type:complete len:111 (+) Transcript_18964:335-667(+)|eukprot:scaffold198391_cov27-Tisochrysis_lutea.AAC.1